MECDFVQIAAEVHPSTEWSLYYLDWKQIARLLPHTPVRGAVRGRDLDRILRRKGLWRISARGRSF
jgi:hypothetical protein